MSPSLTQGFSSSSNSFLSYTVVLYTGRSKYSGLAAKTAYFLGAITFDTYLIESLVFFVCEIVEYTGTKN
jgi:hypothetical protein